MESLVHPAIQKSTMKICVVAVLKISNKNYVAADSDISTKSYTGADLEIGNQTLCRCRLRNRQRWWSHFWFYFNIFYWCLKFSYSNKSDLQKLL
jgi:hypothetical protein